MVNLIFQQQHQQLLEGQLTKHDNYQDWIQWVKVEEDERIVGSIINLVLSVHNSKFGNSSNFIEVFLDGNRWMEICSKI